MVLNPARIGNSMRKGSKENILETIAVIPGTDASNKSIINSDCSNTAVQSNSLNTIVQVSGLNITADSDVLESRSIPNRTETILGNVNNQIKRSRRRIVKWSFSPQQRKRMALGNGEVEGEPSPITSPDTRRRIDAERECELKNFEGKIGESRFWDAPAVPIEMLDRFSGQTSLSKAVFSEPSDSKDIFDDVDFEDGFLDNFETDNLCKLPANQSNNTFDIEDAGHLGRGGIDDHNESKNSDSFVTLLIVDIESEYLEESKETRVVCVC